MQRATLKAKGYNPDVLIMTATPIPRTLSLTVYGDLDVSILDELPPGRTPVVTKRFYEKNREMAYRVIDREIEQRFARWKPPQPKHDRGILSWYAENVSSSDRGAVLEPRRSVARGGPG